MPGSWVWNYWAKRYEGLWVQKWALGPTREAIYAAFEARPPRGRLLDAGCGVGQLLDGLASRWPEIDLLGVDPSAAMIERARQKPRARPIDFRVGDLLDEERGPFDTICMCNAFPYVVDFDRHARRLYELLRPGGRLLVVQANAETLWGHLALRVVKLTTSPATYHSRRALCQIMEGAGFVTECVGEAQRPFWVPMLGLCTFARPEPA